MLEGLCAEEKLRFVASARSLYPESGASALVVAGGSAIFVGPGSPVNQASGLGFSGKVAEEDIAEVEGFFASRGAQGRINVCPLADESLLRVAARRGWVADCFENVLALDLEETELPREAMPAGVEVRAAHSAEERELWARIVSEGFYAPEDPSPAQARLGRIVASRTDAVLLTAFADGAPAGTGEVMVEQGVAWLSADTTLPQFRRRGIQKAMQLERLRRAQAMGCAVAVAEALPGSASQRNMERLGFRVLYTRVDLIKMTDPERGDPLSNPQQDGGFTR
jgi:GNAT superfamily N-acetyltransferase